MFKAILTFGFCVLWVGYLVGPAATENRKRTTVRGIDPH